MDLVNAKFQKWISYNQTLQDVPVTHLSMLSSSEVNDGLKSNMASKGHIWFFGISHGVIEEGYGVIIGVLKVSWETFRVNFFLRY